MKIRDSVKGTQSRGGNVLRGWQKEMMNDFVSRIGPLEQGERSVCAGVEQNDSPRTMVV